MTDASEVGIGLRWKVVSGYIHQYKKLTDRERKFSAIEWECLAIVWNANRLINPFLYLADRPPTSGVFESSKIRQRSCIALCEDLAFQHVDARRLLDCHEVV